MNNVSILEKLADPNLVHSMTVSEKLMGAGIVALLGMCITFIALLILWGLIAIMTKVCAPKPANKPEVKAPVAPKPAAAAVTEEDDEELIAVITAAIAASLQTSTHNLVVKNIVRVDDSTPAWGRAGRIDQMNRMM